MRNYIKFEPGYYQDRAGLYYIKIEHVNKQHIFTKHNYYAIKQWITRTKLEEIYSEYILTETSIFDATDKIVGSPSWFSNISSDIREVIEPTGYILSGILKEVSDDNKQ